MKIQTKVAVLLAASSLILSGCSKKTGEESEGDNAANGSDIVTELSEETTVTFWHTLSDHHEEHLQQMVAEFEAEHENMRIELQAQPLTDFDSKLLQAVRNGTGPNMTTGYPNTASQFIDADLLVNLTPYVEHGQIGIPEMKDSILEGVYEEATQWDGQMYIFPRARTGEVLFYNKTVYDELGLEVPTTWEELAENSRVITEAKGKPAFGFDSEVDGAILLLQQKGGDLFDVEKMVSGANSPEAHEVFEELRPLYEEGVYRLVGEDQYFSNPFGAEAIYSYIGSSAGFGFVEDAVDGSFEIGVAPVPQIDGGEPYVNSWGGFGMVFNGTPEENLVAYTFFKWAEMEPEVAAEASVAFGSVPIAHAARETEDFQNFLAEEPAMIALSESLENVGYLPAVRGSQVGREAFARATQSILVGSSDIDEALEIAESETNEAMTE